MITFGIWLFYRNYKSIKDSKKKTEEPDGADSRVMIVGIGIITQGILVILFGLNSL